ncbi:exported hypothetical protein [uncultured Eubacteriales bacterium]|uniref:Uncharacterized protein n=1 Tax=uncultured Eubacteriales bacterium TaxID=172733 RepID=A0A212KGB0_9FIRM|nr:exported hypothetical protein [uncultured Eubacteriales bacterium]
MKKIKAAALVSAGYFSPLVGVILFGYLKFKKSEKFFQNAVLIGIAIALALYIVEFCSYHP